MRIEGEREEKTKREEREKSKREREREGEREREKNKKKRERERAETLFGSRNGLNTKHAPVVNLRRSISFTCHFLSAVRVRASAKLSTTTAREQN